ncbi:hypothetical protein [Streptomyces graminilatus]|uniref:hypothetical protein n=1 Tax=Streptomyces graminilatus TaxID=1464070 RepID=UPI0012FEC4B5|nr:hypothetical protein [Streptomyces graminilatus]
MAAAPTALASEQTVQAAYCDSSGYTAAQEPMERCTTLTNGILYHVKRYIGPGTNIYTTYSKTGGSTVSGVQLGYNKGGTNRYSSSFSISSGDTVKKTWTVDEDKSCDTSTGLLKYPGGSYQTPVTHC